MSDEPLIEKMLMMLVDQIKFSDEQTIKTIEKLKESTEEVIENGRLCQQHVGEMVADCSGTIKNQSRDLSDIITSLKDIKKGQTILINSIDVLNNRLYKFYWIIGITFTITMVVINIFSIIYGKPPTMPGTH